MFLVILIMFSLGRLSNTFRFQSIRCVRIAGPIVRSPFMTSSLFSTTNENTESEEGDEEMTITPLRRGNQVNVKILQFGPLGASVAINGDTFRGLILQKELSQLKMKRAGQEVVLGEELTAYVERVKEDGKVDIALRPVDMLRIEVVKNEVLEALQKAPDGTLEIGDKSNPERIASFLQGMSKSDFKNAVGALFKEGLVKPNKLWTKLVPVESRPESIRKARKNLEDKLKLKHEEENAIRLRAQQRGEVDSDVEMPERNNDCCVFVGNLPPNLAPKIFTAAIEAKILPENIVNIRIVKDKDGLSRGFAYIELKNESLVAGAIEILKGHGVAGRKLRADYADPEKRFKVAAEAKRLEMGLEDEEGRRRRRGGETLTGRARTALTADPSTGWAPRYDASQPHEIARKSKYHPEDATSSHTGLKYEKTPRGHVDPTKPAAVASLYIGNLPYDIDKDDLKREIERCVSSTDISSVRIIMDRETGQSKGYGYVDLLNEKAAEKIYEEMHNYEYKGRPMKIDDATR